MFAMMRYLQQSLVEIIFEITTFNASCVAALSEKSGRGTTSIHTLSKSHILDNSRIFPSLNWP